MDDTASYRIQAVARLTGVPAATLRAWERRYGFPSPARSTSSYRLYSDKDIELVKRMNALVSEGVAPNEAARQILGEVRTAPRATLHDDPLALCSQRIVAAAQTMDEAALARELRRALMLDHGPAVYERILAPALVQIGQMWQAGAISVAHEHFASHLIAQVLQDLLRIAPVPPAAPSVLFACVAEEQHVIPLYGAALLAASWGYRPIVLGARTPPSAVARALEAMEPALVGLSATIVPEPASAARELIDAYADACGKTPWLLGGAAAPKLARFVEARGGRILAPDQPLSRDPFDAALLETRARAKKRR